MKILHVIDSMAPNRGGPPRVCANLINQQSAGHQVSLASYSDAEICKAMLDSTNITIHSINSKGLRETAFGSNTIKELTHVVAEHEIVHIHNMWEPILVASTQIARRYNVPYVVTPHGMLDPWSISQKTFKKKVALFLGRRRMLEQAKFIHVLTTEEEMSMRRLNFKNRCEVVPNGVNLSKVDQALDPRIFREEYPTVTSKPFVLFLGRLHYVKGLDILAEALPEFFSNFPEWRLVVAGPDGGAQCNFEQLISKSGCAEKVHVIGPIYGDAKFSLIANCEVFCQPSRQEGFSVSILEALSASKPVAISSHCRFSEVALRNCGTIDHLNPTAIAKSLCQLAGSSERQQMGKNGRKLVEEKYTWSHISKKLLSRYFG